jgi:PAS domain S-box-containing protein
MEALDQPDEGSAPSPGSAASELRVHQIELETQNEELRRAQEELEASRARYFDLYNLAPVGYLTVSQENLILEANLTAANLLGVARGKLVRQPLTCYIFPEDQDIYYRHRKQLLETGEPQACEMRLVHPDASPFWVHLTATVAHDAERDASMCHIVMSDISERKQAEKALQESEDKYRRLVEDSIDGIAVVQGLEIKFVNPALLEKFGYQHRDEIVGLTFTDFVAPEYRDLMAERGHAREEGQGVPAQYEFRALRKDGTEFDAELSVSAITYEGEAARQGIIRDITERKQTEEALRESEERFRTIFAQSPVGIEIYNTSGKLIDANPACLEMFGVESVEAVRGFDLLADPNVPLEARSRLEQGGTVKYETTFDFELVRQQALYQTSRSGQFSVDCLIVPLCASDHSITGYLVHVRDITERKRAEEALRESHQLLEKTFASLLDAVFIIDADTTEILDCNPAASEIFGYSHEEMLRRTTTFLHVDQAALDEFRNSLYPAVEQKGFLFLPEFQMKRKDGTAFPTEHSVMPLEDERGERIGWVSVVRDITERKWAEEALRRSLEETARGKRLLLALSQAARAVQRAHTIDEVHQTIGEGLTTIGLQANILALTKDRTHLAFASTTFPLATLKKAARLTGLSPAGYRFPLQPGSVHERCVVQRETIYSEGLIEHLAEALPAPLRPLAARLTSLLGVEKSIIAPLVVGDETAGILSVAGGDLSESDAPAISAFASQASIALENARLFEELHAAQQRLATLSRQLVAVQEAERRHLARELHDQVGQTLTGLKLVLQMSDRQRDESRRQARLQTAQSLIDDLATRVEDLSLDLRPSMLDDLGLLPTLLWHLERYTAQTGVQVRFQHTGLEGRRFTPEIETATYRLVQEALTNVARHAGASKVLVRLWVHQDVLGVQIQDAGRGFDPAAVLAAGQSTGLSSMCERVALLEGELTIESAPGAGTRLMAELPLATQDGGHDNEGNL